MCRASTGAKLGGGGVTLPQAQSPLAGAQRFLTHVPLHLKPSLPKLRDKGQREPLSSLDGGEQRAWAGTQRGPVQVGTAQPGISQHRRQLHHVETPCALRFWKVTFLAWRERWGIGSQNPHEEIHWLVLPACTARGSPSPPTAGEQPGCFRCQTCRIFRPG